jgi:hypothetical protein
MRDFPNFFRQSYGDGWALVGDAGYHKDPIIAQGISDAFRSAEWLTDSIDAGFGRLRPLSDALAEYQRVRDEQLTAMYNLSCNLAMLDHSSPEMLALLGALRTNETERNRFFGTLGGVVSPAEYYAPDNLKRIIAVPAAPTVPAPAATRYAHSLWQRSPAHFEMEGCGPINQTRNGAVRAEGSAPRPVDSCTEAGFGSRGLTAVRATRSRVVNRLAR